MAVLFQLPNLGSSPDSIRQSNSMFVKSSSALFTIIISILSLGTAWSAAPNASDTSAAPPNILFFLVDDMGWQDTSVPFHTEVTDLNRRFRTPHMEVLAREGMKFTQAYAYAVCSPSRISLMTGMNAARHQVTNWTLRKSQSPDPEHPIIAPPAWNLNGLSTESGTPATVVSQTLPGLLTQAGYHTIHVGKAHFGAAGTPGEDPLNLGFDVNIAGHAAGGPGSYHADKNFSAAWRGGDTIWDVPGLEAYHGKKMNLTEVLTLEASEAMATAVAQEKPFYLYMSHYAVHAPWEADRRFYQKYLGQGLDTLLAKHASMVESMDHSLGTLMKKLDELGVADNTIVVFMSDNGSPKQMTLNRPLRGHKLTPYEGGIRVPMIVKWPGVTPPATVCDDYVMIDDVFPTFLEMAGVPSEQYDPSVVDGVSWAPLAKGEAMDSKKRSLFWHFPHTYDQYPYSIVRQGDWKLIYLHTDERLELYNLKDDLGEVSNLSKSHPEKVKELAGVLTSYLKETGAGMPTNKKTQQAVTYPIRVTEQTK